MSGLPRSWHRALNTLLKEASEGGVHRIENILVCCLKCNCRKGGKSIEEWLSQLNIRQRIIARGVLGFSSE